MIDYLIDFHTAIEAMNRISDSICEAEAVFALCELPTVELIRCKDCKHRYTDRGMGFCKKLDSMFYHYEDQEPIDADFYCKWAERNEE